MPFPLSHEGHFPRTIKMLIVAPYPSGLIISVQIDDWLQIGGFARHARTVDSVQ